MNTDRDRINSKYVSRYSLEEQGVCVKEYLAGASKKELADKWGISERTIERWIKKYKSKEDDSEFQMRERDKKIPQNVQKDLMKILSSNAILYGFHISIWNERRVVEFTRKKYGITITRYIAKKILKDIKGLHRKKDEENEIKEMLDQKYKIIILDYLKIGKIKRRSIEAMEYGYFKNEVLNVNIGIAISEKSIYAKIIFSDIDIREKQGMVNPLKMKSREVEEKDRESRKITKYFKDRFLNSIMMKEDNERKIVFIMHRENYLEKYVRKERNYVYIHNNFEKRYRINESVLECFNDINNKSQMFDSYESIIKKIKDKIGKYNKNKRKIIIIR